MPQEGGKYQYSLSILQALNLFPTDAYLLYAIYTNDHWESQIPKSFNKLKIKYSFFHKIIRGFFLKISFLFNTDLKIWRRIGKYLDTSHKAILSLNPDLVLYPTNSTIAYELNIPTVATIFDLMHKYETNFPEVSGKKQVGLRDHHYKMLCKYCTAILVDSMVGKDHVLESYKAKGNDIHILPYIAPNYDINCKNNPSLFTKYNIPDKFIFYPAQFWKHKNHKGLLKAIKHLKDGELVVNLVLVGSNKNTKLKPYIEKLNLQKQVYILNYVSNAELVALYKKATALVMPTFFGPTNIPQLEAFMLGCPVITSNIYGIPAQVGDAALLVNPKDSTDIANKISMLWNDNVLRRELIKKGYIKNSQWTLNEFSKKFQSIVELTVK